MDALTPPEKSIAIDAERFRPFVDNVADYAIYTLSPDGHLTSWNEDAQRLKGYTAEEIIGQHFSVFYSAEDRAARVPAKVLQIAMAEGKFEDEGWRIRKDGSEFRASVLIEAARDQAGELLGFAKVTKHFTDCSKARDASIADDPRFPLLVEGITDFSICMLSRTGSVINWNAGAARITGYVPDEILGKHFSRFFSEEDQARGLPMSSLETASGVGRFEGEGWRLRKDGKSFWANVVINALRDKAGTLIGFAEVTRDITERRMAAESIERTREALAQSQKLESIGKLTGGIAHDFNNILAILVSGVELLSREVQSQTGARVVESMRRATAKGTALTQQLMSFARQQPSRPERCNLTQLIGSFEARLRRNASDTVRFELRLASDLNPVMVDASQFETALMNLVTNANEAMPAGGIMTISAENLVLGALEAGALAPGKYVRVSVADTGVGMTPEVASRAIEPFFTTKNTGRRGGMGLSQVYGLVQQSGGDLRLENNPGGGTRVSVYLPALVSKETDLDLVAYKMASGNDKALIVDDLPDVLEIAVELFRSMGYDVLSASNAEQALEIMNRTPGIDVLFTDVVMPGVSGITLGHEARKRFPDIKVVLASGYPVPALSAANVSFRDFHFVNKPYRMSEILKILRKVG